MKHLKAFLAAIVMAGITAGGLNAQVPRLRTSAPPEYTAQKGKNQKKEDKARNLEQQPTVGSTETSDSHLFAYNALKSNLAYDIFGILNLAYEFQVAKHWTVEIPVIWSLWDWKDTRGIRTVAVQPGAKYWFSRPGNGSAVGADFDLLWYNVRWNGSRYQVEGHPAMGASILYAYTLNIGRGWKAEFSLGVGYINSRYNKYYNIENGALIDTRTKNYFGPTRLGITLVYSL